MDLTMETGSKTKLDWNSLMTMDESNPSQRFYSPITSHIYKIYVKIYINKNKNKNSHSNFALEICFPYFFFFFFFGFVEF